MTIRALACAAAAALATISAPASAASFIGDNVTIKRVQGGTLVFKTVDTTVGAGFEYTDNFFNIDISSNEILFDVIGTYRTGDVAYEITGLDFDDNPATANVIEGFATSQIFGSGSVPIDVTRATIAPNGLFRMSFNQTNGGGNGFARFTLGAAPLSGAVPEPATWAMMIGGFGLAGGALRARRRRTRLAYSL